MPARGKRNQPVPEAAPEAVRDGGAEAEWVVAVQAAEAKKAIRVRVLDVHALTSFTDHFVICSGSNPRQIQAIADEVEMRLKQRGRTPLGVEGYDHAEWVLVDYGDFLVHIFSESAREYYDLERLWRQAKPVEVPPGE